jgi:hypothetical protein
VKGIAPIGLYGRLHDYHRPAIGMRVYAEEKAGVRFPFHMDLAVTELCRIEWFEKIYIFSLSRSGRKRHTKTLVDMITVPQPCPTRSMPIGIVAKID